MVSSLPSALVLLLPLLFPQAMKAQARETQSGRSKAEELKQRRAQAQAEKRERLKQEFLRKKVAAIKAGKQAAGAGTKRKEPPAP